ncbi:MAG: HypC/HybG/HupF family hydrogenase formation chaperone [Actinomycetota bacterium]
MCLAIPGQIIQMIDPVKNIAKVDVGGVRRNVNVGLVAEEEGIEIGDWVLIHVGFALSKVDEQEAEATLELLKGLGEAFDDEIEQLKASDIS